MTDILEMVTKEELEFDTLMRDLTLPDGRRVGVTITECGEIELFDGRDCILIELEQLNNVLRTARYFCSKRRKKND